MASAPARSWSPALAWALLGFIAAATVVFPGIYIAVQVVRAVLAGGGGEVHRPTDLRLLGMTIAVAGLIAILATAIAIPVAWASRAWSPRWLALILTPMLLPSYLAYAGWGLLRAPGTPIGDWLMRGSGGPGMNWYPIIAGRVLAIGGLTLWVWPLAFLLLAIRLRRVDPEVFDALRLDPGPRWRKGLVILGMSRGAVLAALAAVFLVMLGSAVPFHVAQLDTYAIAIWRALDEAPHARHGLVWVRTWPLVAISIAAAVFIARWAAGEGGPGEWPRRRGGWSVGSAWAVGLWGLSVVFPVVLFALSLKSLGPLARFWQISGGAFWNSLGLAVSVASAGGALLVAAWYLASGRPGRQGVLAVVLGLFLVAGLAPGVLVGSGLARAYGSAELLAPVADSWAILLIGHLARFGFVALLGGMVLARSEPSELRDLRLVEGGDSFRGWALAAAPPQVGVLAGAVLAMGLLSLHEIEATVMLQPPTSAGGSFAWRMLQNLHFARMDELSAGVLVVAGAGLITCGAIVALWPRRKP